jgi:hypothetical protein
LGTLHCCIKDYDFFEKELITIFVLLFALDLPRALPFRKLYNKNTKTFGTLFVDYFHFSESFIQLLVGMILLLIKRYYTCGLSAIDPVILMSIIKVAT